MKNGTAAALAEAAATALAEHETARRVNHEMAPAAFGKAPEIHQLGCSGHSLSLTTDGC